MALEIIGALLPAIGECAIVPVKEFFSYAFNYKKEVEKLGSGLNKLTVVAQRLQHSTEEAKSKGQVIGDDVRNWQARAEKAIASARQVIQSADEQAKTKCCLGMCPNLKQRYQLGFKSK